MSDYLIISTFIWDKHDRPVAYPTNLVSNSRVIINNGQDILLRYLKLQLINLLNLL